MRSYTCRMRTLRRQLIELLEQTRRQHQLGPMPPRLAAALVHESLKLVTLKAGRRVALVHRTISHGELHRHVVLIRCPDQAFYLDAIKGYLLRRGIQPIGQQTMVARMDCGEDGCTLRLREPGSEDAGNFMLIALHLSATLVPRIGPVAADMTAILRAVELSVRDFAPMRRLACGIVAALMADDADSASLLDWMCEDHYLFFGLRHGKQRLGIFRNRRVMARVAPGLEREIEDSAPLDKPGMVWLNLAGSRSHLYSAASVEVVLIAWNGPEGRLEQAVLIGHFSRSARYTNASRLPRLARMWETLRRHPLLAHSAFYRREMRTLFDRMPKPVLLSTRPEDWHAPLKGIVDLASPLNVVVQWLETAHGNLDYLLIAIAADRFGPQVMRAIEQRLGPEGLGLTVLGFESFGVGPHRILFLAVAKQPPPDAQAIERAVQQCIVFWKDLAKAEVLRRPSMLNIPEALAELERLPPLYADLFPPAQFVRDLVMRRRLAEQDRIQVRLAMQDAGVKVLVYARTPPSLGRLVDVLRAFDLEPIEEAAVPFGSSEPVIHISAVSCRLPKLEQRTIAAEDLQRLKMALEAVLNSEADHDPLNALLLRAGLSIDELAVLITLRNHLVQIAPDAALLPLTDMLLRNPRTSRALVELFATRHMLGMEARDEHHARLALDERLNVIENLHDDRWFRALAELVDASLRTNAYVRNPSDALAIKIAPGKLSFAPEPRPWREIFVHGPSMEGVHLRAGPIARGGIRHSDRPADFRTEILELMATQTIKNGQIVPTGAKGGFVLRGPATPEAVEREYRRFIRALLSVTDNLVDGTCVPPDGVRVPEDDRDDPYLVVAADKGTAKLSDAANDEAAEACFWMGDAFASGGSHGYDHKAVGITAKGAWVVAAHHCERLGLNAWRDPLTCVGIGDMGGDVFGNGMLLNPRIRLIAAFNHRHIFLDPDPDPEAAFAERRRLFEAGLGWDAYDARRISEGGGVFARSAKSIRLAKPARDALGIEDEALSGEALIRAILRAPVDMLYNGGIGTYVKASTETHLEVRDPANNSVRVDAGELRCRIVVEGGNLGLTQAARLEYAAAGGLINTDAIDNAAGVNMSDHEVNLKILLGATPGVRIARTRRNRLLRELTDEVTRQCLDANRDQARALTLAEQDMREHPPRIRRLRDALIESGWLDAGVTPGVDDDAALRLRPTLSVLLGQEKNRLQERLVAEGFAGFSSCAQTLLADYFPARIRRRFGNRLSAHPLASRIVATQAANRVVNHAGLASVHHLQTLLENSVAEIVEALLLAEELLETDGLREAVWSGIDDVEIAAGIQHMLQEHRMRFAEELLRMTDVRGLGRERVERWRKGLHRFRRSLAAQGIGGMETSRYLALLKQVSELGLAPEQAAHLAAMPELAQSACALHLSAQRRLPLSRCLAASQACLHLLPLERFEEPLRSPDWGGPDAHRLRREWLHRLSQIKRRAIERLLEAGEETMIEQGSRWWHAHPLWEEMEQTLASSVEAQEAETRHMRLLLALTRLEDIVGACAD